MSLDRVPSRMGWGEACRVWTLLARDPNSWVASEINGWQYPLGREGLILSDLYDATANAHFKKPKKYHRPWDEPPKRFGDAAMSKAHLRAVLDVNRKTQGRPRDARGRFVAKN